MPKLTARERIEDRYILAVAHRDRYRAALQDPKLEAYCRVAFEEALVSVQREIKLLEWVLHEIDHEREVE